MFILAKSFTNKKGEMFLKIFPRQYPSIETAHAAMQSDYQEELKKRHLDRSDEDATADDVENMGNHNVFVHSSKGAYECNSRSRSALSAQQLNYLNNLYTKYNSVRHPYSHWSASDVDTAVITSIDEARNLLNDGIILVNQYYTLF